MAAYAATAFRDRGGDLHGLPALMLVGAAASIAANSVRRRTQLAS